MKKFIKSTIISFMAIGITMINGLTASANNITIRDINGDGGINAADALIIQQYLSGILTSSAPSQLDINNNGIVDIVDINIMTRYITTGSY